MIYPSKLVVAAATTASITLRDKPMSERKIDEETGVETTGHS